MHGHVDEAKFLSDISGFLGTFFLVLALMNAVMAFYLWRSGRGQELFKIPGFDIPFTTTLLWMLVAVVFTIMSPIAYSGSPDAMAYVSIPKPVRAGLDVAYSPMTVVPRAVAMCAGPESGQTTRSAAAIRAASCLRVVCPATLTAPLRAASCAA